MHIISTTGTSKVMHISFISRDCSLTTSCDSFSATHLSWWLGRFLKNWDVQLRLGHTGNWGKSLIVTMTTHLSQCLASSRICNKFQSCWCHVSKHAGHSRKRNMLLEEQYFPCFKPRKMKGKSPKIPSSVTLSGECCIPIWSLCIPQIRKRVEEVLGRGGEDHERCSWMEGGRERLPLREMGASRKRWTPPGCLVI